MATTKTRKKRSRKTADAGIDMTLIKAISNPDRMVALNILNERVASPNELGREIGVDVNNIAYHVRELEKFGFIELVDTKPRRGATEHFYRAIRRAHFRDEEWLRLPASIRESLLGASLKAMGQDVSRSAEAGKFEGRADRHWTHTPGHVDEAGWAEFQDLLTETLERYMDILGASQERRIKTGDDGIPVALTMLGFEMADATEKR